ncbi:MULTISPECIES: SDR family oxidoreductase [Mycobacterium]|uniref:Oxidoreductase EphD n=1 Tax=Mycobacterium kiyosense TaxID=2871094 RepID=A0A9P3QAG4_9MYCO|nr:MULTISPECIES: SDR family oxidoreductase [Mycobacterium]BDB42022.1 putative oxidoreductase EphD [Mycobacterium kiyosense]BDE14695.1 putative oxidoreductase EphD [Mycobacterium sp. 20KCMC460]GLB81380.1 putative oxidoreductase EphD [Mycobacterium kiyosense]GLB90917.1 putative oxidoreductase EphD [Mycobacterium kiyosense]GLB97207.1 putative oxidoreductase EphD [Mycobacterium kiyosense]
MRAPQNAPQRFVDSGDGVRIAVYEDGNREGPTVVLVHGWPDSHALWDGVVPLLAQRFRIVRYDNRGVGLSSAPKPVSAYTMARYADDFAAVIAELSPGQPVHVLAHDWGSVGVWEYLARPGASDRVATFTSVSGPAHDQLVDFIFGGLRRPWRPRGFARSLSQALRLTYMAFFSVPVLAPLLLRLAFRSAAIRRQVVDNIPAEQIHHSDNIASDAANSVKVYPANYWRSYSGEFRRQGVHIVDVPVQLIVNTKDKYVRPHGYDQTSRWVPRLWRRDIRAGHFSPMSHPQVMAAAVHDFADLAEGKPASRALLRAQIGRPRGEFGDTLVSVTGAGSGIGRETALAFAREGAELVLSDIDEATVKETAAQIAARGGVAHSYVLDVSDAEAVEAFADRVCAEHGLPDIVVNNAGIGQAGNFLDTPPEQFDRVLDVNLGGVVNGCRAFGRRLVERGTGGHIVNVSSMAAYAPLQSLNAYCTSKAATFMFSDCLRAELDAADVGLTTICPGVVNTNIVATTRFDAGGKGDEQLDGRRGQLEKMFALRSYGPDKVANAIVSAVKKNKPIRPVAPEAYALYGVSRVLPQALRSTARMRVI